jgi:hypothetical protein
VGAYIDFVDVGAGFSASGVGAGVSAAAGTAFTVALLAGSVTARRTLVQRRPR